MKNILIQLMPKCRFWGIVLLFAVSASCSKTNTATPVNPYGGTNGQTTFWASNNNAALYPITVTVNGTVIGSIGGGLGVAPDCESAVNNVVKYVAVPGTYNFTCTAANGAGNWTGAITIKTAGCFLARLQ